jgi:1,4-dihydroxy-2-naphthoate octaprenyltransferase
LILAHPRRNSLCGALFDALGEGARQAGVECRELILSEMRFDPNVHADSAEHQPLEPDLVLAPRAIHLAEHFVFVYRLVGYPPILLALTAGKGVSLCPRNVV